MKRIVCFLLTIGISLFGYVTVISPNGGEAFERGSKTVISWDDNIAEDVKIELYKNDLYYSTIVDTTESNGSYEWAIPVDLFGLFKIKISSVIWSDTYGISQNTFEIKKGSINILSPQSGDVLQMFEEKPIGWTNDFPEDVKISLIKNTKTITELSSKSNGLRNWNFYTNDLTAGNDYRLRIESKLFDDVYAETGNFSIKGTNNVYGSVSGTWTEESSPYILTDSTFVENTVSLVVTPNVTIRGSKPRINFNVLGTIEALGAYDSMIEFDGISLSFHNSVSADTSKIKFAHFTQNNNQGLFDGYKVFGGTGNEFSSSVKQVTDGGFIFTGYTTSSGAGNKDVWLVKTDSHGNLEWSKTFGGLDDDAGKSVAETKDGGFIITGYTRSFGAGLRDLWLIKTDAFGNHEWDRTFGGSDNDGGESVKQTFDSGFIIAGYTKSFGAGSSDLWLIKTDAFGNHEWDYTFGGTKDDIGYDVEITPEGAYVITGSTKSFSANHRDVWVVKTSSDGIEEWSRTYGDSYENFGYSIQQTKDGGFIIGGTADPGVPEPLLLKISDSGSLLWLKKFPCGYGHGHRACEAADGGYLLVGQNQATMFLAKTDVDGEVLWEKSIKETAHNYIGFSLERTYDGGFIVVGTKDTYDVFLVKTDPDGNTSDTTQTISINDNSKAVIQNCIINNINNYGITVNNASPVISNNLIIQNKGGIKFEGVRNFV